jgi:hypothetical protein
MKYYLFTLIDDRDSNYIVLAKSEKEAEEKLAKYCDLEELGTSVSDCFYLRDCEVIV